MWATNWAFYRFILRSRERTVFLRRRPFQTNRYNSIFALTSQLRAVLNSITEFSDEEFQLMESFIESISLKRNQAILKEGQYCSNIYFVASGSLCNCYYNDGIKMNLNFTFENQFTTSIEAYINREPSKIAIQAIEKSLVWSINIRAMRQEYPENINVTTLIRRLAIRILFATEEHHNMMIMHTPAERYSYLMEKKPELIQKLSLSNLASYIGITRETLSRIRGNKY